MIFFKVSSAICIIIIHIFFALRCCIYPATKLWDQDLNLDYCINPPTCRALGGGLEPPTSPLTPPYGGASTVALYYPVTNSGGWTSASAEAMADRRTCDIRVNTAIRWGRLCGVVFTPLITLGGGLEPPTSALTVQRSTN